MSERERVSERVSERELARESKRAREPKCEKIQKVTEPEEPE